MQSTTAPSPSVQRQSIKRRPRAQSPPPKRRRTTSPLAPPRSPPSPRPLEPSPTSKKWFRKPSVVWYRGNDLRVEDHPALFTAAQRGGPVVPLFVWDPSDGFGEDLGPVKQWWLSQSLQQLQNDLRRLGVQLYTRAGKSTEELRRFLADTGADAVFWNRCYEPQLLKRDEELREELALEGFTAESFKAEVLVEPWELTSSETSPRFETFHGYMSAWMTVAPPPHPLPSPSRLKPISTIVHSIGLDRLGFEISNDMAEKLSKIWKPGSAQAKRQLDRFLNDIFPIFGESQCRQHFDGTSQLSPHIRFGEISPRRMYHATRMRVSRWDQTTFQRSLKLGTRSSNLLQKYQAKSNSKPGNNLSKEVRKPGSGIASTPRVEALGIRAPSIRRSGSLRIPIKRKDQTEQEYIVFPGKQIVRLPHISQSARAFLKNLCLRDFSFHVLYHFPDMNSKPLIPEFSMFPWANDNGAFERWRDGATGYPIIDAAMRQLHESGWIHNRMRFLLACFLTKYLLLPWSKGLRQFYRLLVDGDHSSNALGWQWTAGSNTDAFPVTTLVNPVRQAYKQDPNGDYVRRWLPQLAKLPAKYIHRPWKAPREMLKKCGIEIGATYPERIVDKYHARRRAVKAMAVMKQVFASNELWKRRFEDEEEKLVTEWPRAETEVGKHDEANNTPGKGFLLPSLWALLQSEQSPPYLQGSIRVGDSLSPMDTTACLVDGALAIPMDDQPESIEQALISAHEYVDADPRLSSDALLSPENRTVEIQCLQQGDDAEQSDGLFTAGNAKSEVMEQIEEPLRYTVVHQSPFKEERSSRNNIDNGFDPNGGKNESEKSREADTPVPYGGDDLTSGSTPGQEALSSRPSATSFPKVSTELPYKRDPVVANEQIPDQQLLTSQEAEAVAPPPRTKRSTIPSDNTRQLIPPTDSESSQPIDGLRGSKGIRHSQGISRQPQRVGHDQSLALGVQHIPQEFVENPISSPQLETNVRQSAKASHSQHISQQPFATSMPTELDSLCATRFSNAPVPVSPMPTVTMSPSPLVMSSVLHANDIGSARVFGTGDASSLPHPSHARSHSFYGMRQFLPMLNANPLSSGEQPNSIHPSALHAQKVAVPSMFPLTYGVYGTSVFDHNTFAGHVNQARFSANVYPSQPHPMAPMQVRAPEISSHVLFQMGPNAVVNQPQANTALRHGQQDPNLSLRNSKEEVNARTCASASKARNPVTGGRTVQESGSSYHTTSQVHVAAKQSVNLTPQYQIPGKASSANEEIPTPHEYAKSFGYQTSSGGTGSLQQGRANSKSVSRSRNASRPKRTKPNQTSGSRGKNDGKRTARERFGGNGPDSGRKLAGNGFGGTGTTLKNRQEILESVLASDDHEYRGFAQYLSDIYEFTSNTNWQTSRDYVRLCTLKDDYHKKCSTEKDKLKIYRIKDFFSKVLKLEVTGEWDRHNHGGVRGPYVYGIRLKQEAKSKPS